MVLDDERQSGRGPALSSSSRYDRVSSDVADRVTSSPSGTSTSVATVGRHHHHHTGAPLLGGAMERVQAQQVVGAEGHALTLDVLPRIRMLEGEFGDLAEDCTQQNQALLCLAREMRDVTRILVDRVGSLEQRQGELQSGLALQRLQQQPQPQLSPAAAPPAPRGSSPHTPHGTGTPTTRTYAALFASPPPLPSPVEAAAFSPPHAYAQHAAPFGGVHSPHSGHGSLPLSPPGGRGAVTSMLSEGRIAFIGTTPHP